MERGPNAAGVELGDRQGWPLTGHEGPVWGALPLPDGRVLSWSKDRTLRVWDLATGEGRPLRGHQGSVSGALPLPDGRVLSWGEGGTLRVWDLASGNSCSLTGHTGWVTGALLLPHGRVLSWSHDRTVKLHTIDETATTLTFDFDATPTVVIPDGAHRFFVGDQLGRVHFLEEVRGSA